MTYDLAKQLKECTKCRVSKPRTQFYKSGSGSKDGLNSWCNSCFNASRTEYQKQNPTKRKGWNKKYATRNRSKITVINVAYQRTKRATDPIFRAKERMKSKNREYLTRTTEGHLTLDEWMQIQRDYHGLCALCLLPQPLTVDHIKPLKLGGKHSWENVEPLCRPCNSSKGAKELWMLN
jgi:hypothetical protein